MIAFLDEHPPNVVGFGFKTTKVTGIETNPILAGRGSDAVP
jgi:hypothetical protein